jgi:hypothetical protein
MPSAATGQAAPRPSRRRPHHHLTRPVAAGRSACTGANQNLYVAVEQGNVVQQPLAGKAGELVVFKLGHMGLRNAQALGRCRLGQPFGLQQVV